MGNENENLDKEGRKLKKMREEAIKNDKQISKAIFGEDENSDENDEKGEKKKEKEIDEYDKEISRMLFDEEAELDEGERLKKNRKKMDKKAQLKNYAEQIREEQFMEEINRSKSVNKLPIRDGDSDDGSDSDDFDAYKRWKERKNKKKKQKELKDKKNNVNNIKKIKIKENDDEDNKKKHERNKKKRNISSGKDQNNYNTEGNINENEGNLNINKELEKNNAEKPKKKGFGGLFSFGKKGKEKEDKNKNYKKQNSSEQGYSFNSKPQIPQINLTPSNNGISDNYNKINSAPVGYNPMNPQTQNYTSNEMNQIYNNNNIMPMGDNPGLSQGGSLYTSQNGIYSSFNPALQQPQSTPFPIFGQKPAISKKVYSKIKQEDIRIVSLYLKNGNIKYQEGLDLCGRRKYYEAQTCFGQARYSFLQLNKLMNANPKTYPTEFRNVISKKINEKLALVYQSLKECSSFIKNNNTNQILKNPQKAEDILKNINTNNNNYNNDFNFNNMNMNNNNNLNNMNNNNADKNNPNKKKNIHEKEEDEMDEKIESEIMVKNPGVKFDDIIGMKEMKRILYEIIVVPTIRPDLFTGIRKPQRGILLFGPPGTGKTMIAKAIASECNSTFFNISASSLTSKWVGESEKTVKSLFKLAYKKVPSIIVIDEIDSILSKRNESENEATKRLKTEFLIQFDGLGSNTNARLLVIAATNRPMDLDEALLRRLPKRVYCGPLDEEGRFEFIKKVINRVETRLSDRDIKEIAKMTNGYSNSDLKELCKEAAFQPVRELTMEQILHIDKFRPLYKKDLVKACSKIRGTLSHKVIDELLVWNEQFGGV